MNQSLERHNLPKLTQKEIDNLNTPVSTKEIKSIINTHSKKKVPGPDRFTSEFYQTLKENIILQNL